MRPSADPADPSRDLPPAPRTRAAAPLLAASLAGVLASACCIGPLVLLSVGLSGAWIGSLTMLEPYRPLIVGVALAAMLLAGRRIWRPAHRCDPGQACAAPAARRGYKIAFGLVALAVVIAVAFPYLAPLLY